MEGEKALPPEVEGGKSRGRLIERNSARRAVWNSGCIESSYMA